MQTYYDMAITRVVIWHGFSGKVCYFQFEIFNIKFWQEFNFQWTVPARIDAPCMDECASNTETDGDIQRIQESTWQQKAIFELLI